MAKYKFIAIPAQDTATCEIAQRLALSFGYRWATVVAGYPQNDQPRPVAPLDWLVFNPNVKSFDTSPKAKLDIANTTLVGNTGELLKQFNTPDSAVKVVKNTSGTISAELAGSTVTFVTIGGKPLTVDREIIKAVSDELGFTVSNYPLVTFRYPDSEKNTPKVRYVKVTAADSQYVSGYEYKTAAATGTPEFKKFLTNRVLSDVALVKFPA